MDIVIKQHFSHGRPLFRGSIAALGLALAASILGCGEDDDVDVAVASDYTQDYYSYGYYYPADLAYGVPYYVDDWYDAPYLYSNTQPLTDASSQTAGAIIRALATGDELCPGQVTVSSRMADVACGGDEDGKIRSGVHVSFEYCALENGGMLFGTIDLDSRRSFSNQDCGDDTVVNVAFSSKFENISYTAPDGSRYDLPSMFVEGSYARLLQDRPAGVSLSASGSFNRYGVDGTPLNQIEFGGNLGVAVGAPTDTWLFKLYGPLSLYDVLNDQTLTATAAELTHEDSCCHPVDGTITLSGTDIDDVVTFGPECGQGMLNGDPVNLPDCPEAPLSSD